MPSTLGCNDDSKVDECAAMFLGIPLLMRLAAVRTYGWLFSCELSPLSVRSAVPVETLVARSPSSSFNGHCSITG